MIKKEIFFISQSQLVKPPIRHEFLMKNARVWYACMVSEEAKRQNLSNAFLWAYFGPKLVACLPGLGRLPLLKQKHTHLVITYIDTDSFCWSFYCLEKM